MWILYGYSESYIYSLDWIKKTGLTCIIHLANLPVQHSLGHVIWPFILSLCYLIEINFTGFLLERFTDLVICDKCVDYASYTQGSIFYVIYFAGVYFLAPHVLLHCLPIGWNLIEELCKRILVPVLRQLQLVGLGTENAQMRLIV